MIDVDLFKQYNDHYGHVQGDEVIRQVSKLLLELGKIYHGHVGRYGGDEFIIAVDQTTEAQMKEMIQSLHKIVKKRAIPNIASQTSEFLTLSVGYHIDIPKDKEGAWPFVVQADQKLYNSKSNRTASIKYQ